MCDSDYNTHTSPQYVAFLRWLSFKSFKGPDSDNGLGGIHEPRKKKRHTTATSYRELQFDPPPSKVLEHPPSTKPFKSMVGGWWLKAHPNFKPHESSAEWLVGFCDQLTQDDLHPIDWDHIKELILWGKEKEREIDDMCSVAGPSSETM